MMDKDVARKLLETLQAENPKASPAEIARLFIAEVQAARDHGEKEAVWALIDTPLREWAVRDAMADDFLRTGYRQGFITAITVMLTASLLFFRFVAFEPSSGPWTLWGGVCAMFAGASILLQFVVLLRALRPSDERIPVYLMTLRLFAISIILLVCSFAADIVAQIVYADVKPVLTTGGVPGFSTLRAG